VVNFVNLYSPRNGSNIKHSNTSININKTKARISIDDDRYNTYRSCNDKLILWFVNAFSMSPTVMHTISLALIYEVTGPKVKYFLGILCNANK